VGASPLSLTGSTAYPKVPKSSVRQPTADSPGAKGAWASGNGEHRLPEGAQEQGPTAHSRQPRGQGGLDQRFVGCRSSLRWHTQKRSEGTDVMTIG